MTDQPEDKSKDATPADKELPAHEILKDLFKTIINEAERNARFAEDMLNALPDGLIAKIEVAEKTTEPHAAEPPADQQTEEKAPKPKAKNTKPGKATFDPAPFNPVILYRDQGEDLMRVKLNKLTIANLNAVIRHFQLKKKLKLTGNSPTKQQLITALIAFAKHFDAQRKGAAA